MQGPGENSSPPLYLLPKFHGRFWREEYSARSFFEKARGKKLSIGWWRLFEGFLLHLSTTLTWQQTHHPRVFSLSLDRRSALRLEPARRVAAPLMFQGFEPLMPLNLGCQILHNSFNN
ncbi:uncharacterized protein LOC133674217 [Populus nigra]|uniref:uncharacterized protein LOC133674217 n=1 Tax=Populus nigra TaxID=3691 RepID=UPI002B26C63F|nr:uncharacterized protein LOC133674217 [Populus nigra]